MHAPTRLSSLRRMHRDRIVRMNPEGIASQVHPWLSRIVPNRKIEVCVDTLIDEHTQKVTLGPLEDKRPNCQVSEPALPSLRVGIDVRLRDQHLWAVPAPCDALLRYPRHVGQATDAG